MKARSSKTIRHFQLRLLAYGNHYYIDRIADLEKALARRPHKLQIEMIGVGEIPADLALLIRSLLLARSPRTQIITHARSSLQAGAVLIWLMGDRRLIRPDAYLHIRRPNLPEDEPIGQWEAKINDDAAYRDSYSTVEPEEGDYCRVLDFINEFLPVRELSGRLIGVPVLRQFGLVESDQLDQFLATALARNEPVAGTTPVKKRARAPARVSEK